MVEKRQTDIRNGGFEAGTLLIGFTGSLGSGCTFLAKGIQGALGVDCHYYRVSDVLREQAQKSKRKRKEPTTEELQDLGNALRRSQGTFVLAKLCLERIKRDDAARRFSENENTVVLIDGIRNDDEVRYLRMFPNFFLLSIHAEESTRDGRLVGKGKRFKSKKEFQVADKRDQHENDPCGQQVTRCNYLADVIVDNNDDFPDAAKQRRRQYFNEIVDSFIRPMIAIRKGESTHDRPPSIDEALMTMAYCVSKRSSCLKRKVGAVVAYVTDFTKPGGEEPRRDACKQFQVVSSGYNDVPLGSTPCVFSDFQKCYREHLQERHAGLLKCCPSCGAKIPSRFECPHCKTSNRVRARRCSNERCLGDPLNDYTCQECGCAVFRKYVPGAEESPGKLLDMCVALHAEENAIIGMAGISKSGNGEFVLYSTTYPCNLCANKIVAAGIRQVVFAEPYTMEESKKVLDAGGVTVRRFHGFKSRAYFRLYG